MSTTKQSPLSTCLFSELADDHSSETPFSTRNSSDTDRTVVGELQDNEDLKTSDLSSGPTVVESTDMKEDIPAICGILATLCTPTATLGQPNTADPSKVIDWQQKVLQNTEKRSAGLDILLAAATLFANIPVPGIREFGGIVRNKISK